MHWSTPSKRVGKSSSTNPGETGSSGFFYSDWSEDLYILYEAWLLGATKNPLLVHETEPLPVDCRAFLAGVP